MSAAGAPPAASRTVLAFDFGLRRIGVAVGETGPLVASPLTTVAADDGEPRWPALDACIGQWQPALLLVGEPHYQDGSEGTLAGRARAFADRLAQRYTLPVELVDEQLTSRSARAELREQRRSGARSRRVRREDVDAVAAQLILRSWLEQTGGG